MIDDIDDMIEQNEYILSRTDTKAYQKQGHAYITNLQSQSLSIIFSIIVQKCFMTLFVSKVAIS